MKIKFHILFPLLILTISCNHKGNNSIENNTEEIVFKEINSTKSQFEIIGNSYQYLYRGDYKNLSPNIFDKTLINMSVEFLLDNGNLITLKDYSKGGFLSGGDPVSIKVWKPNETVMIGDKNRNEFHLDDIKSDYIPMHYKDYPVKQVFAVFHFETTDVINQTKETYEDKRDITKEWNAIK